MTRLKAVSRAHERACAARVRAYQAGRARGLSAAAAGQTPAYRRAFKRQWIIGRALNRQLMIAGLYDDVSPLYR